MILKHITLNAASEISQSLKTLLDKLFTDVQNATLKSIIKQVKKETLL